MGAGIAQLAVEAGFETIGREVSAELGEHARDRIAHFLTRKVEKGQLQEGDRDAAVGSPVADHRGRATSPAATWWSRRSSRSSSPSSELFAELDRITAPDAILATNTSALSVTEIAAAAERPRARASACTSSTRRRCCRSSR